MPARACPGEGRTTRSSRETKGNEECSETNKIHLMKTDVEDAEAVSVDVSPGLD